MNKLTLDIGTETDSNDPTLLLFIDGIEFRKIISDNSNAAVFYTLVNSSKETGDYLIFTCVCGVADCSGWDKVQVVHNDRKVTWTFSFDNKQHIFTFAIDNYKDEISKIQQQIDAKKIILQPQFTTDPE